MGHIILIDRSPVIHSGFVAETDVLSVRIIEISPVSSSSGKQLGVIVLLGYLDTDIGTLGETRTVNSRTRLGADRRQDTQLIGLTRNIGSLSIFTVATYHRCGCKRKYKKFFHNKCC